MQQKLPSLANRQSEGRQWSGVGTEGAALSSQRMTIASQTLSHMGQSLGGWDENGVLCRRGRRFSLILVAVKPKSEELLYLLLWSCEQLMRPTFRNLTESYEGWAYRNGFKRELDVLESRQLIEKDLEQPDARIYRLSTEGRVHALGGRDPTAEWDRPWDGLWRLVLFDVPVEQDRRRKELRRYLQGRGFGCLQRSVWITPHPLAPEKSLLRGEAIDVSSLILLEGRACAGESDSDLVLAAWDFAAINQRYQFYLEVLDQHPTGPLAGHSEAKALQEWAKRERSAWYEAVSGDPLLPAGLLPAGYQGKTAWLRRGSLSWLERGGSFRDLEAGIKVSRGLRLTLSTWKVKWPRMN